MRDPGDESDVPDSWGPMPDKPIKVGKLSCPYCGGTKKIHGPRARDNAMYHDRCGGIWLQFGVTTLKLTKADDGR